MPTPLYTIKEWLDRAQYPNQLDTRKEVLVTRVHSALVMIEAHRYGDEWLYSFSAPVSFYTRPTPELMHLLLGNAQHLHIGTPRFEAEGLFLRHTLLEDELSKKVIEKVINNLAVACIELTKWVVSAFGGLHPDEYFRIQDASGHVSDDSG